MTYRHVVVGGLWHGVRSSTPPPEVRPDDSASSLVGRLLGGRFRIDRVLARGGMGTLLGGHDEVRATPVVVKVVGGALRREVVASERLLREAKLACRVQHPSIVRVLDLGMLETLEPYLVMEQLVGEDVASLMARERSFSLAEVIDVARSIGEALAELHASQIVHRDVKTENVFVLADAALQPRVKLIDFGLAILDDETMTRITGSGHLLGTAEYIAPECVRGERATAASDVYALATTLFEMLAGRAPFAGASMVDVLVRKSREPAPRFSEIARRHAHLDPFFAVALDRDPRKRPTALELVDRFAASF